MPKIKIWASLEKFQRTTGVEGNSSSSKQFVLLPINSIHGLLHIITGDTEMGISRINNIRRLHYAKMRDRSSSNVFYVNRSYCPRGEVYAFVEI